MTDELNDLTGIPYSFLTLQGAVVLEGRPLGVTVGMAGWDAAIVQHAPLLYQTIRDRDVAR